MLKSTNVIKEHWPFILGLGAIALIRPVMKMTGIMDILGQQFGSILMTILISLAWLVIVLVKKTPNPVAVLVCAGLSYALFAIIVSGILSPILDGKLQGPLTNPLAIVSVFSTNAIWGLLVGGLAKALGRKW
ncbi:hypothetical protein SAMN02799630_04227 [Paenibacillus sp. UNCCL117]|uniref:hypothetical protein n=1 Tax=unclassified Paenibacillus TaxID=185978 RepID=UPI00087DFAC5|nr:MULTISPECIES: hypothetical protein [unclassified Paenibacillus]SDD83089.1 hypothetical protein SAMN04488602_11425 [Paenibacillus sp. cl123]SFW54966.1 hypothetical protein SAMN02799630_04227 [Paenibacillus sp. UNCCL117]